MELRWWSNHVLPQLVLFWFYCVLNINQRGFFQCSLIVLYETNLIILYINQRSNMAFLLVSGSNSSAKSHSWAMHLIESVGTSCLSGVGLMGLAEKSEAFDFGGDKHTIYHDKLTCWMIPWKLNNMVYLLNPLSKNNISSTVNKYNMVMEYHACSFFKLSHVFTTNVHQLWLFIIIIGNMETSSKYSTIMYQNLSAWGLKP